MKISNKEIIEWLRVDGYSEDEATEQVLEASISTQIVTIIEYNNGVKDIIYKDENNKIHHLNPYSSSNSTYAE